MKRATIVCIAIVCIFSLLSWSAAQSSKPELFDTKKAQQELEIMRGILNTTLGIVSKELQGRSTGTSRNDSFRFRSFANVGAFYLYGQGATFTVPLSGTRFGLAGIDEQRIVMEAAQAEMEAAAAVLEASRGGVGGGYGSGYSKGTGYGGGQSDAKTPQPPQPAAAPQPVPPAPPAPPKQEEIRKRVAEAQEQVARRRENMEKQRQKQQQFVAQIKGYLMDALANYGDSITILKPSEYINIVITTDSDFFPDSEWTGSGSPSRDILSVQKSTVSDYKAGRLTLEAFKAKVLQYNQ